MIVSMITTDDQAEAFVIFETLNARGLDLSTSDLLKNHLLRTSSDETIESNLYKWEKMITTLEDIDPTSYIRAFWNSYNDFTRTKPLYKKFRKKYDNNSKVAVLLNDLTEYVEDYKKIADPQKYKHENKTIHKLLINLNDIKASSFYPLYLALLRKDVSNAQIISILKMIINYYVRNIVIYGQTANSTEIFFAKLANEHISKSDLTNDEICDEIVYLINSKIIDNKLFIEAFTSFSTKQTTQTRYLLSELERNLGTDEKTINEQYINIEHIMPLSNSWGFEPKTHNDYVNRLGNLTLLGSEYNQSASDKQYVEKLSYYAKSDVNLTKKLLKYSDWGIESINNRQRELAEQAILIWRKD